MYVLYYFKEDYDGGQCDVLYTSKDKSKLEEKQQQIAIEYDKQVEYNESEKKKYNNKIKEIHNIVNKFIENNGDKIREKHKHCYMFGDNFLNGRGGILYSKEARQEYFNIPEEDWPKYEYPSIHFSYLVLNPQYMYIKEVEEI
jgi:hypothetical protein